MNSFKNTCANVFEELITRNSNNFFIQKNIRNLNYGRNVTGLL